MDYAEYKLLNLNDYDSFDEIYYDSFNFVLTVSDDPTVGQPTTMGVALNSTAKLARRSNVKVLVSLKDSLNNVITIDSTSGTLDLVNAFDAEINFSKSATLTETFQSAGTYTLTVSLVDAANVSNVIATSSVVINVIAPSTPVVSLSLASTLNSTYFIGS